MPDTPGGIFLRPIGVVHNDVTSGEVRWEKVVSRIEVREDLLPALEGLEEFSHLLILFYFDRLPPEPAPLQVRPERRPEMPLVGVLATRSPQRPNPIGLTAVELLRREENTLWVRGLDAFDGTPVLDIKPYLPRGNHLEEVQIPDWLRRLWSIHDQERENGR